MGEDAGQHTFRGTPRCRSLNRLEARTQEMWNVSGPPLPSSGPPGVVGVSGGGPALSAAEIALTRPTGAPPYHASPADAVCAPAPHGRGVGRPDRPPRRSTSRVAGSGCGVPRPGWRWPGRCRCCRAGRAGSTSRGSTATGWCCAAQRTPWCCTRGPDGSSPAAGWTSRPPARTAWPQGRAWTAKPSSGKTRSSTSARSSPVPPPPCPALGLSSPGTPPPTWSGTSCTTPPVAPSWPSSSPVSGHRFRWRRRATTTRWHERGTSRFGRWDRGGLVDRVPD